MIGADRLLVVYLSAPLEVCRTRDTAGHYRLADAGDIANFPGVSAPYEAPENPDLVLPTDAWSVDQCVDKIIDLLEERAFALLRIPGPYLLAVACAIRATPREGRPNHAFLASSPTSARRTRKGVGRDSAASTSRPPGHRPLAERQGRAPNRRVLPRSHHRRPVRRQRSVAESCDVSAPGVCRYGGSRSDGGGSRGAGIGRRVPVERSVLRPSDLR